MVLGGFVAQVGSVALVGSIVCVFFVITANQAGWNPKNPPQLHNCTCNCWDGLYKGNHARSGLLICPFENCTQARPLNSEYKSVYFNLELHTLLIFCLVFLYCDLAGQCARGVISAIWKGDIRWPIFVAISFSVFPHLYCFWSLFNYLNDRTGYLFWNQVYYTIGELLVGVCLFKSLNRSVPPNLWCLSIGVFVSLSQMAGNVYENLEDFFEIVSNQTLSALARQSRDIAFFVADGISAVVCVHLMIRFYRSSLWIYKIRVILASALSVFVGVVLPTLVSNIPYRYLYRWAYLDQKELVKWFSKN
eukprot:c4893_g1_i1.p1 GENE.c4893_g1_i1~~c4893_g1_i1.p1  ORF type:complete len:305 (+),score=29.38 c4893_g1_i1:91-1005(+)